MADTAPSGRKPPSAAGKTTIRYFGDYELGSEIARGGMGVVYKAQQLTLNRPVAVKMILAGQLADDLAVDRFYAEAEAAANLNHPNIVAIHEVGEHDGQHYFSMDYVDGRNLAEWAAGKPVAPAQAAALLKTIAEAIHYAHQRGTLHRDLKPSNVLIDADDQPHVTDFGLAKTVGSDRNLTHTGDIMGTPSYMPPEQATGRHDKIGPHTDVYALGAILYELLTGQPPFPATNSLDALLKAVDEEPAPPRSRNATIPPDMETICLKCLEKSPPRRYASARELAEDLGRFLNREPIHARPASFIRKAASWTRRRPGALAAAAALVICALVAGVFYLVEENSFLRAQQANPALTRQPGPRTEALETWRIVGLVLSCAAFYPLGVWAVWRTRRLCAAASDPNRANQTAARPVRLAAACLGLALTGISVIILAKAIRAFVWEGPLSLPETLTAVYVPGWVGLWLLALVVRDYRLATYGRPALTTAQRDAIQKKLIDFGPAAAIKNYRELVRAASLAEAKAYVEQLDAQWRQRDPQTHAAASWRSRELNWRLVAITAALEAAALMLLWAAFPTVRPMGEDLAKGFALGLFLMAVPRLISGSSLKRSIARFLLAWIAVLVVFAVLEYFSGPSPHRSQGTYLLGVLLGAALVISAYTPKRPAKKPLA
jgi:tRNA A-37 threonylcarbamoyl transferase component Bud32